MHSSTFLEKSNYSSLELTFLSTVQPYFQFFWFIWKKKISLILIYLLNFFCDEVAFIKKGFVFASVWYYLCNDVKSLTISSSMHTVDFSGIKCHQFLCNMFYVICWYRIICWQRWLLCSLVEVSSHVLGSTESVVTSVHSQKDGKLGRAPWKGSQTSVKSSKKGGKSWFSLQNVWHNVFDGVHNVLSDCIACCKWYFSPKPACT